MKKIFLVAIFGFFGMVMSAQAQLNIPECETWKNQLVEIEQRIEDAQSSLKVCEQALSECSDLNYLVMSLELEKEAIQTFLKNFCH